jgi:hypothetical protein
MRRPCLSSLCALAVVSLAPILATGQQAPTAPKARTESATAPVPRRTPWGDPDLQGLWNNSTTTPLERPADLAGKEVLTDRELAERNELAGSNHDRAPRDGDPGTYNQFWWEEGTFLKRTSLITDPADGRMPSLTAAGQKARAARAEYQRAHPADSWEDRNLAERCLTRGAPKLPGGYNNNVRIVQSPGYVAILQEMIHEVRIIPVDGRPHIAAGVRQWMGDSRGHWEGDTLVVDTTNYHEKIANNSFNCCGGAGAHLHVVERFRRVDADTIDFEYTVDDPTTWTRPWTASVPMRKTQNQIYEYACHEGNYGMDGILRGARAQEKTSSAASEPSGQPAGR